MTLLIAYEGGLFLLGLWLLLLLGLCYPFPWLSLVWSLYFVAIFLRYQSHRSKNHRSKRSMHRLNRAFMAVWAIAFFLAMLFEQSLQHLTYVMAIMAYVYLVLRFLRYRSMHDDGFLFCMTAWVMLGHAWLEDDSVALLFVMLYLCLMIWLLMCRQLCLSLQQQSAHIIPKNYFWLAGLLGFAILLGGIGLQMSLPHVGIHVSHTASERMPKWGERLSLTAKSSPWRQRSYWVATLQNLTYSMYEKGLYLRLTAYEKVDADGFYQQEDKFSKRSLQPMVGFAKGLAAPITYQIALKPLESHFLATLGVVEKLRFLASLDDPQDLQIQPQPSYLASEEIYFEEIPSTVLTYEIKGDLWLEDDGVLEVHDKRAFVEANTSMDNFLEQDETDKSLGLLAEKILREANLQQAAPRQAKVLAIRDHLRKNYAYTTQTMITPPSGKSPKLLDRFLFEDKQGHCEYFAVAYAMLLRSIKIPSRVAVGFHGGIWQQSKQSVWFYTQDAHAWVEWYGSDESWHLADATPALAIQSMPWWQDQLQEVKTMLEKTFFSSSLEQQVENWQKVYAAFRRFLSAWGGYFQGFETLHMYFQQIGWLVFGFFWLLLGSLLVTLLLAIRFFRLPGSSKKDRLEELLESIFVILLSHPLPKHWTLRYALSQVRQKKSLPGGYTLIQQALEIYEKNQFSTAVPSSYLLWVYRLQRLKKDLERNQ